MRLNTHIHTKDLKKKKKIKNSRLRAPGADVWGNFYLRQHLIVQVLKEEKLPVFEDLEHKADEW